MKKLVQTTSTAALHLEVARWPKHCYHSASMASLLIRNLTDTTVDRLKRQAKLHGRSLQAEVKEILERAAAVEPIDHAALAAKIRARLSGKLHSDSAALIREDRDR
jgi:plasmid stability protein